MSTAHRPTWAPAKGGEQAAGTRVYAPSRQTSAKNQNSHTQLKFRCAACWCECRGRTLVPWEPAAQRAAAGWPALRDRADG